MGDKEAAKAPPSLTSQHLSSNSFTNLMRKWTGKTDGRQEMQQQQPSGSISAPNVGAPSAMIAHTSASVGCQLPAQPRQGPQFPAQHPMACQGQRQLMMGNVPPSMGNQPMFVPQYMTQASMGPQPYIMFVTPPRMGTQLGFVSQANAHTMMAPQFVTQQNMGYQVFSPPRLGPQVISQPTLRYQVISQPRMIQQNISQPGMGPQFRSQPGMGPQFNSQPGTGPQFNSQPGTGPQFNSQPGTGPQANLQPGMSHQVSPQPMKSQPGFSRPKMPLPAGKGPKMPLPAGKGKPAAPEKQTNVTPLKKAHNTIMDPPDKANFSDVMGPRKAVQTNVYSNKKEELNLYEEITFKDGPGNETYEQPDCHSSVGLDEEAETYLEIIK